MIIKWYDACSKEIDEDEFNAIQKLQTDGKELLVINTTYGKLLKKLKSVVVLINEESTTNETNITVIPRGWIISPKKLK